MRALCLSSHSQSPPGRLSAVPPCVRSVCRGCTVPPVRCSRRLGPAPAVSGCWWCRSDVAVVAPNAPWCCAVDDSHSPPVNNHTSLSDSPVYILQCFQITLLYYLIRSNIVPQLYCWEVHKVQIPLCHYNYRLYRRYIVLLIIYTFYLIFNRIQNSVTMNVC